MKHLPRWWLLGCPKIYVLMNVGLTWWKATPKRSETLPAPHPVYAAKKNLNGHRLKFCGPDSYNPSNSYWNNHCYIIMCLSVVCLSRIGCRSVWLKGTPNGSGLLSSPQSVYATTKVLKVLYGFQSICKRKCKHLVRCKWYNCMYLLTFGQCHP